MFLAIAKEKGFNPLVPENWYSLRYDTVMATKVFFFFFFLIYLKSGRDTIFEREEKGVVLFVVIY